jgi:hypothetical protein
MTLSRAGFGSAALQKPSQNRQLDTVADIAEKIHAEISKWQSCAGGRISEQGKQIIVAAVSAIVYDPHPGWRFPSGMEPWPTLEDALVEVQQDAISKLGPALDQIAARSPDGKTINTFEMLHSFHDTLQVLCPFQKE